MSTKQERLQALIDEAGDGQPKDFEAWKAQAGVVLRHAVGPDDPLVAQFDKTRYTLGAMFDGTTRADVEAAKRRGVLQAVAKLRAAITQVNLTEEAQKSRSLDMSTRTKVFIVHGHDDGLKETVARFLAKLTGDEPVILHEQVSGGDTVIEKLERFAATARYAVVLATPDDLGRKKSDVDDMPRARQNVIFELGYFFAALGRSNVALLYKAEVERPSDTDGVVHIAVDDAGAWKILLTREIEGAGINVDRTAL
ncbi:MAG: nucleotide-binding protein [Mycobacterium sp.]